MATARARAVLQIPDDSNSAAAGRGALASLTKLTELRAKLREGDTAELKAVAQDESWEMRARAIEACGYEGIAFREFVAELKENTSGSRSVRSGLVEHGATPGTTM